MFVGELFLAAFIQVLFDKLTSGELLKFARKEGVHTQLKKWSKTLLKIQAVLDDAGEKQMTNAAVKLWLDDLRDLAYDLDDILDEFATESLRRRLKAESQASTSTVRNLIPTCCTSFNPIAVMFNVRMGSKIDEISTRLQDIAKQKNDLDLKDNPERTSNRVRERSPTTSLVDESRVYGREKDKESILELLLRDHGACDDELCVIPIVGMGGVGKTTLAQLVYNDDKVKDYFDLKVWACISEDFDVFKVTKRILESITGESHGFKDLNMLQVSLKEKLSKKKFLLVLDDVWNENYEEWDLLCGPFRAGVPGSKIIVTTRNVGVVSIMGSVPAYHLQELAIEDCLSLFAQHALGTRNFDGYPDLKELGESIVIKCKGLPLAAKTLGGLLRTKLSPKEWEDILNSEIWDLPVTKSGLLPALRLSYHHLPSHLKQLFAYCSIFPKDYEFEKDELVLLWMAEGFLTQPEGKKRMEDLGGEYFRELLSRSFFQQSSSSELRYLMHDLTNDLAQFVAGEICFRLDDKLKGNDQYKIFEKARHSSFIRHKYEVFAKFKAFYKVQCLRTFLPLSLHKLNGSQKCYFSYRVLLDLLPKLRCLRVLSLNGYFISELPNSIGNLKHLRYLNLSETSVKCLPATVSGLYNLQTLSVRSCCALRRLPTGIGNLVNLRHLDNANTGQLEEMPLGIGKLTCLQTLSKIVVGRSNGLKLRELRDLSGLRGTLSILGLHHVTDVQDAREANLKSKLQLDELVMEWTSTLNDSQNKRLERIVLDVLQPHENLRKLEIKFFGGTQLPSWIGHPSFTKLVHLNLPYCGKCVLLPSIGQLPVLRDLSIQGMHGVKSVGVEFFGAGYPPVSAFPSLETLKIVDMLEWEEWSSFVSVEEKVSAFPCLRELTINKCPKLLKLSLLRLPSLRKLNLQECREVVQRSMVDLSSLTSLRIHEISELNRLHEGIIQSLRALEDLEIEKCAELKSLWQDETAGQKFVNLRHLRVRNCPQLVSLGEEDQGLPHNLECLELHNCGNLEKLPSGLCSLASLRELSIRKCPKLNSFPENCFLPMLRHLDIEDCMALESLPNGMLMHSNYSNLETGSEEEKKNHDIIGISHLEFLRICGCSSLSLPRVKFPTTLKDLEIWNFANLEPVTEKMLENCLSLERLAIFKWVNLKTLPKCLHGFVHLTGLYIDRCPSLESFPERGLPTPNLRRLEIYDCENLKSLPDHMQSLKSLQHLQIHGCRSLESFSQGGLPPNLTSLWILDCFSLKPPITEWGLHGLTSLCHLGISGGYPPDLSSFPDACLFPTTLTSLGIQRFMHLESLSMGLQNLTSLEHLWISECPKLCSLPKMLLPALSSLDISHCPLLKQNFSQERGEYWPSIADIPRAYIDNVFIHEL